MTIGRDTTVYHLVGQTILDRFTNRKSGKIRDSQITFRAFTASTKDIIHFDQDMAIENEIIANAGKSGLRIKEIKIGIHYDFGSPVRAPIRYIVGVLKTVTDDIETNKPLYFYALPGFALATCSSYMSLKFLEVSFLGIESLYLWPLILMVSLFIAGVYITMRGIVMNSLLEVTE